MRHIRQTFLFFACALAILNSNQAVASKGELSAEDKQFESRDLSDYGQQGIPTGLVQAGRDSKIFSPYVFLVDKKARVLSIWQQDENGFKKVAAYTADIGKNVEDKRFLGDHATPEGIYFMETVLEGAGLDFNLYGSRAFTLNYPNYFDRLDHKTGNGIWLHAVPDKVSLRRGSRGCVVVRNDIIKTLQPYFKSGYTPVIIQNEIKFISADQHKNKIVAIQNQISAWQKAWQSKDTENYISFYHPQFKALGMNRTQWKAYKDNLNKTYQSIQLQFSRPVIYEHKNQLVARFIQSYRSDLKQDLGEKTLYFKKEGDKFLILNEEWKENSSASAQEEITRTSFLSANHQQ